MITQKLKNIFLLSIVLFIAHGTEELTAGFYNIDSQVKFMFGFVERLTPLHAAFVIFQIMLWFMLIVSYLLLQGEKWQLRLMAIPGLVMVYELYHIYKAIIAGGYYPGLITALFFPIIGFFFWKEYITNLKIKS